MAEPDENVALEVVEAEEVPMPITHYMQMALRMVAVVNDMLDEIPYIDSGGPDARRFVRSKAGVPRPFVRDALSWIQADARLGGVMGAEANMALVTKEYVDAFNTLRQALGAAYDSLTWTLQYKEAQLASFAQKIFGYSKTLTLDSNDVTLEHTMRQLRHARKRPRKRRKGDPDKE